MNVLTILLCLPVVVVSDTTFDNIVTWFNDRKGKELKGVLLPMDEEEAIRLQSNETNNPLLTRTLNVVQLLNSLQFADQSASFTYTNVEQNATDQTIKLTCNITSNNQIINWLFDEIISTVQYYPTQTWQLREKEHSFLTGVWKPLSDLTLGLTRHMQQYHYDNSTGMMYLRLWRFADSVDVRLDNLV